MNEDDWIALTEWIATTKAEAGRLARLNEFDLTISCAFEAQVEVLAAAQEFMAEREMAK